MVLFMFHVEEMLSWNLSRYFGYLTSCPSCFLLMLTNMGSGLNMAGDSAPGETVAHNHPLGLIKEEDLSHLRMFHFAFTASWSWNRRVSRSMPQRGIQQDDYGCASLVCGQEEVLHHPQAQKVKSVNCALF